ncbi:Aste57867_6920 [Aphanomyces stellatus]|uniref:Aste57867_6920 protein n=1 Tax=Aphanomyces stellatus TaxID=120398 RepID=A0A485KG42_9STRA|nr:hypothetical protein As57867_006898 [Aphanomyces stellatus]VFT83872.1 Aste57867_6920 [Aphanomyces stellatus]
MLAARSLLRPRPWAAVPVSCFSSSSTTVGPYSRRKQQQILEVAELDQSLQNPTNEDVPYVAKSIFTVPHSAPWPAPLHGTTIHFSRVRQEYKKGRLDDDIVRGLDAIRFVWDARQHQWEMTLLGLASFRAVFAHTNVPRAFSVPSGDMAWPRAIWGRPIGRIVSARQFYPSLAPPQRAALADLGFHEASTSSDRATQTAAWIKFTHALRVYRQLHGHVAVPQSFVVPPAANAWPTTLWHYALGARVTDVRHKVLSGDRARELDALGFVWEVTEYKRAVVLAALENYHALHGHVNVPVSFVVPSSTGDDEKDDDDDDDDDDERDDDDDEPGWPRLFHGLRLGNAVMSLRSHASQLSPVQVDVLDDLGFVWEVHSESWDRRLRALACFRDIFDHLRVPQSFCVPFEEPWPRDVRGMKLGRVVKDLRESATPSQRATLDAMGFVWKLKEWRQAQTIDCLEAYHAVFGHRNVPATFVVPKTAPWPQEFYGFRLGSAVRTLLMRGDLAELNGFGGSDDGNTQACGI